MVRMTVTEPRAALAGVMLNASFAMFMVSMATFKEERTVSRRFGRWGLGSMVKSRGDCGTTVRREGCNGRTRAPKDMSGDFVMTRLVQPVVINGENHICAQRISSNSYGWPVMRVFALQPAPSALLEVHHLNTYPSRILHSFLGFDARYVVSDVRRYGLERDDEGYRLDRSGRAQVKIDVEDFDSASES